MRIKFSFAKFSPNAPFSSLKCKSIPPLLRELEREIRSIGKLDSVATIRKSSLS